MLQKGVDPYEYMRGLERFNEILLPVKKEFYSSLAVKSVRDADCKHAKIVWEVYGFGTQDNIIICTYKVSWDLWTRSNSFSFCTRIGMASVFEENKLLELLTDADILLMTSEGITGGICKN